MQISYDVTDWEQEYDSSSERPQSADDAIDLMKESNLKLGKASMLLIVGREKGKVDDDSLPSNKLCNLLGMGKHLSGYRSRQRAIVKIKGKETKIPRYISTVTSGGDDNDDEFESTTPALNDDVTTVDYNSTMAVDRAIDYLLRNVMGRIRDRFAVIAYNDPKRLKVVAKQIKAEVDRLVEELS